MYFLKEYILVYKDDSFQFLSLLNKLFNEKSKKKIDVKSSKEVQFHPAWKLGFGLQLVSFSPATCNVFPVKISQAVGNISKLCPRTSQPFKDSIASTISDAITNIVNPKLNVNYGPVCGCGGKNWTKVADLNMTNTSQQCPTNWNLYSSNGTRGCGQQSSTNTCDSVLFSVHQNYSRVCGKIEAYRRGDADGFLNSIRGISSIEQSYIDGVSVTYGSPGSRRHIWTFVSGDNATKYSSHRCSCSISTIMWPHQHQLPSFIGDNYFCDNGNPGLPIHNLLSILILSGMVKAAPILAPVVSSTIHLGSVCPYHNQLVIPLKFVYACRNHQVMKMLSYH